MKEEKMRIGIEKMKIAHKKRVAIKVFNPDRSNKTGVCVCVCVCVDVLASSHPNTHNCCIP